jgi:hypothetical protein
MKSTQELHTRSVDAAVMSVWHSGVPTRADGTQTEPPSSRGSGGKRTRTASPCARLHTTAAQRSSVAKRHAPTIESTPTRSRRGWLNGGQNIATTSLPTCGNTLVEIEMCFAKRSGRGVARTASGTTPTTVLRISATSNTRDGRAGLLNSVGGPRSKGLTGMPRRNRSVPACKYTVSAATSAVTRTKQSIMSYRLRVEARIGRPISGPSALPATPGRGPGSFVN